MGISKTTYVLADSAASTGGMTYSTPAEPLPPREWPRWWRTTAGPWSEFLTRPRSRAAPGGGRGGTRGQLHQLSGGAAPRSGRRSSTGHLSLRWWSMFSCPTSMLRLPPSCGTRPPVPTPGICYNGLGHAAVLAGPAEGDPEGRRLRGRLPDDGALEVVPRSHLDTTSRYPTEEQPDECLSRAAGTARRCLTPDCGTVDGTTLALASGAPCSWPTAIGG